VKCPKCAYLGFETGDRCKNCGYDFSLLSAAEFGADYADRTSSDESNDADEASSDRLDYAFRTSLDEDVSIHPSDDLEYRDPWLDNRRDPHGSKHRPEPSSRDDIDDGLAMSLAPEPPLVDEPIIRLGPAFDGEPEPARPMWPPAPAPAASVRFMPSGSVEAALPLFTPSEEEDDEPLIKMPATPRAPLAVRRTPDTPRLRAAPRFTSRPSPAPALQFSDEPVEWPAAVAEESSRIRHAPANAIATDSSRPGARVIAAAIDCAILLGIDLGVMYFTVRMAGLSMSEWNVLPFAPMLTFLVLLKIAYVYAFTAVGGQTIGKMAVGTRVIAEDGAAVDAARAMRRTCAGVLSFLLLGLGFVPALFGDRRALHDRLAGTRVVRLRSV
jgi:uncharacterized RDD family membrane protein YckC